MYADVIHRPGGAPVAFSAIAAPEVILDKGDGKNEINIEGYKERDSPYPLSFPEVEMGESSSREKDHRGGTPGVNPLLNRIVARERELDSAIAAAREEARRKVAEAREEGRRRASARIEEAAARARDLLAEAERQSRAQAREIVAGAARDARHLAEKGRLLIPDLALRLLPEVLPGGKGGPGG